MLAMVAVALCAVSSPTAADRPLRTAIWDTDNDLGVGRTRAAGASVIYLILPWRSVAPDPRPAGFTPENPLDPAYRWTDFDRRLRRIADARLTPLVAIYGAPDWAEGAGSGPPGSVRPDPTELARFARAAALRYSGRYQGLPRVQNWQIWAEQNLTAHLNPQLVGKTPVGAVHYRRMLNAASDAIHGVDRDNVVISGGLAPFTTHTGRGRPAGLGPLQFMRVMLCMGKNLRPTCNERTRVDVWAHHPYTSGGPNHHAYRPDDVSLGDLPELKRLLDAAIRARHIVSRQPVRFWVTEFGWDTSPPDPKGAPARVHARWVAEALYRMWSNGISLVTWLQLRDEPFSRFSYLQAGLYYRGSTIERDRPKPALRAFRFPFVALPEQGGVVTWGRTPTSRPGRVLLQFRAGGRWLPLRVLRADRYGIFARRVSVAKGRSVRATYLPTGETSLPFRVVKTRDRPMFAFGTLPG
jgi:hypothetical protein